MCERTQEILTATLVEAMETMAFICPFPPDGPVVAPSPASLISIELRGSLGIWVELVAPVELGNKLAESIIGIEPGDPDAALKAEDALKELMNITCGSLATKLCDYKTNEIEMGLPQLSPFDADRDWSSFVGDEQTVVLDAEGQPVAIRMRKAA